MTSAASGVEKSGYFQVALIWTRLREKGTWNLAARLVRLATLVSDGNHNGVSGPGQVVKHPHYTHHAPVSVIAPPVRLITVKDYNQSGEGGKAAYTGRGGL
jgi:hypothetical protein